MLLQFWQDEASSADGTVYEGQVRPISALAEYVLNTINPCLEPGSKMTWDDVVARTPWLSKQLHGMTASQELTVRRQPLPQPGKSSELEIIMEKKYSEHVMRPAGRGKLLTQKSATPGAKPTTPPPGLTKTGRGTVPKLHLKRDVSGEGWSSVTPKGLGPDVGCLYRSPKDMETDKWSENPARPDCSPLTSELLGPGEELIGQLDYEDVEETTLGPSLDPEIAQAVAHIPPAKNWANVEMAESNSPPTFEPEVAKSGYDVNLVRADTANLGSSSPIMAKEDRMLDEMTSKTPGAGGPGSVGNPDETDN